MAVDAILSFGELIQTQFNCQNTSLKFEDQIQLGQNILVFSTEHFGAIFEDNGCRLVELILDIIYPNTSKFRH